MKHNLYPNVCTALALVLVLLAACASPPSTPIHPTPSLLTEAAPAPSPAQPTFTLRPPSTTKPLPSPTLLPGYVASPSWLPAGVIAFSRMEGESKDAIYLVHTDGTGLVLVANGPDRWNEHPTWSPDGTRIAYHSGLGHGDTFNLWAINVDGSNQLQLTHRPPSGVLPAWSPDGTRIAFSPLSYATGVWHIGLMNSDGSNQAMLTDNTLLADQWASWAPNGKILFIRKQGAEHGNPGDVFAINPDGTGLVQLTDLGYVGGYALSPDGTKMAIHNMKDHSIDVIPADGVGAPVTIVESDFECVFVAMSWSPDGQALALACSAWDMPTGSDLYIAKADGSSITIVPNTGDIFDPAWRP
jgi:Tol biopolymer transport system component